jgi:NDP-sugar pyrophosphorylase family protein
MKAVILAGGEGKRLRPYTLSIAKPMVPILNKPIMEYSINLLRSYGIKDIFVTTCYKRESIKKYFRNGNDFGVNITYLDEKEPLGTAGGIFLAKGLLNEPFIVLSGDTFTNIDIDKVINFHLKHKSLLTLVSKEVENPKQFGVCFTDYNRKLIDFVEKPERWIGNEINTGIYIVDPLLFHKYPSEGVVDFSKDLFPQLIENNENVYVFKTDAYWRDIGNPDQYKMAREDLLKGRYDSVNKQFTKKYELEQELLNKFITRLQVACPHQLKPHILAKLNEAEGNQSSTPLEEVRIDHYNGGWTKIINDPEHGFIIYSRAERRNLAKELAQYYGKKIKKWQKV